MQITTTNHHRSHPEADGNVGEKREEGGDEKTKVP